MKKKDIILLIISSLVIIVSLYFIVTMLSPKKAAETNTGQEVKSEPIISGEITGDSLDTLNKVKKLNDYGEGQLDNIGRANPFGPL